MALRWFSFFQSIREYMMSWIEYVRYGSKYVLCVAILFSLFFHHLTDSLDHLLTTGSSIYDLFWEIYWYLLFFRFQFMFRILMASRFEIETIDFIDKIHYFFAAFKLLLASFR